MTGESIRKKRTGLKQAPSPTWVLHRNLQGFDEAMAKVGFTKLEDIVPWVESGLAYDTDRMVNQATSWRAAGIPTRVAVAWSEAVPSWSPSRAQEWSVVGYEPLEAWLADLLIGMAERTGRRSCGSPVSSREQWRSSGLSPSQVVFALALGCGTVEDAWELSRALADDRDRRMSLKSALEMDGIDVSGFTIAPPRFPAWDLECSDR